MAVCRAHVLIRGRVQGVFFRAQARERALALGVAGWIRNNPDGSVEAVFEGPQEQVQSLLRWCARGPAGAVVEAVETRWEEPAGERDFVVR
jgi:acylphosphatase